MATPTKVFVCYKKILAGDRPNEKADVLNQILNRDQGRFDSWIDDAGLPAGMAWETDIYRRILVSDVLLVLIGPGTAQSPWVQREIALATALGIAIVPIGFDLSRSDMTKELNDLDIGHLQGKVTQNIKGSTAEALLAELRADLQSAALRTKEKQKETLRDLLARGSPPAPKTAKNNQRAATFALSAGGRSLHVASGDMSKVKGIDVLVNSENNYMQMARVFESRTVSAILRLSGGTRVRDRKYEDTIQRELDWQLRVRGVPLQFGEVFATSAGGAGSELASVTKARYIFHVAAVQAVEAAGTVIPYKEPHQIERCVRASLSKLVEINKLKGVISPPDTEARTEQEKLAAEGGGIVRSIVFPLFGTGHGGSAAADVIGPMLDGITDFLADPDGIQSAAPLSDIYISAFKEDDLKAVVAFLQKKLGRSARKQQVN